MPLSEKTVELNLTTELLNWLWKVDGQTYCAFGLTQQQEAQLGFDVATVGGFRAIFVQYKRAYTSGTVWTWHLNRTKTQDQHQRLQALEAAGCDVYYAFPYFDTGTSLRMNRRQLLLNTFWFPPSWINPVGRPTGHHDVNFDTATGSWTVSSNSPTQLRAPLDLGQVVQGRRNFDAQQTQEQIEAYNKAFASSDEESGLVLLVQSPDSAFGVF